MISVIDRRISVIDPRIAVVDWRIAAIDCRIVCAFNLSILLPNLPISQSNYSITRLPDYQIHLPDSYRRSRLIHATTSVRPDPVFKFVKTNGRSPRIVRESRAMIQRSAPTCGARSVLLMTSRSDRVTPGPPLRGILSPPDTSIT